jgi:hypothetical protein
MITGYSYHLAICEPNQTYCATQPIDSINTNRRYEVKYENLYNLNDKSYAIEGSFAIYSCLDKSHILFGDSMRMCDRNGNWVGLEPFCSGLFIKNEYSLS